MPRTECVVGVVGAGYTSREHLKAFKDVDGVRFAGIHSRTRSKAEALAREFEIPSICDSIEDLYSKTYANLVIVTVNELSMNAVSKQCFKFPWKVLLEKPPGYCLTDALDILDHAHASKCQVYVAMNRRFISTTQSVLSELKNLAGPRFIKVQDQENILDALHRGTPQVVAENFMFANSIHLIDYFRVFGCGEIKAVEPVVSWDPGHPQLVVSKIQFDSGDLGLYEGIWHGPGPWAVSVTTPGYQWELRPLEQLNTQRLGGPIVRHEVHPWDIQFKPGFRAQAQSVTAAVIGEPSNAVTLEDAVSTMKLISRIYSSQKSKE